VDEFASLCASLFPGLPRVEVDRLFVETQHASEALDPAVGDALLPDAFVRVVLAERRLSLQLRSQGTSAHAPRRGSALVGAQRPRGPRSRGSQGPAPLDAEDELWGGGGSPGTDAMGDATPKPSSPGEEQAVPSDAGEAAPAVVTPPASPGDDGTA